MKSIRVFISSKQSEFQMERAVLAESTRYFPLLEPIVAEEWAPQTATIREHMLDETRNAPIYVGLFASQYSEATELEYRAAAENPYRQLLIYVRRVGEEERELPLKKLIAEMQSRHVLFPFNDLRDLLPVFPSHLREAIARMVMYLQTLGEPRPQARSSGSVLERRFAAERHAIESLGFQGWTSEEIRAARTSLSAVQEKAKES